MVRVLELRITLPFASKFWLKKVKHMYQTKSSNMYCVYCIWYVSTFLVNSFNFVREADVSGILEEFQNNYKAFCVLQSNSDIKNS